LFHFYQFLQRGLPVEKAWATLKLSQAFAKSALSKSPVTYFNAVGIVPPYVASRVFARSFAKTIDATDDYPELVLGDPITSMTTDERAFLPPFYVPRPNWQTKLESLTPRPGSWQDDIFKYWQLRKRGKKEEEAWTAIAMTPRNAKLALSTDPPTQNNDSGLVPCIPNGPAKDTVARRVFARSVAKDIDHKDIYNDLRLYAEGTSPPHRAINKAKKRKRR